MSSSKFLECEKWESEKNEQTMQTATEELISCLIGGSLHDKSIEILQKLCHTFVPLIWQNELDDFVFSRIGCKVVEMCNSLIGKICHSVHEEFNGPQVSLFFQHIVCIMTSIGECIGYASSFPDLHLSQVHSLLLCSFNILKGVYSHCQDSSTVYKDHISSASQSLALLFRSSHSLQTAVLCMVDKLLSSSMSSSSATDTKFLQDLENVCRELFALCRLVAKLDVKLTISLWKVIVKLVGQWANDMSSSLEVCGMVRYLCGEIPTTFSNVLQSTPVTELQPTQHEEKKVTTRYLKILRFQMKALVAMAKYLHGNVDFSVLDVHSVLLSINGLFPRTLCRTGLSVEQDADIRQQISDVTGTIVSVLLERSDFLDTSLLCQGGDDKSNFACLLLQISILDQVSSQSDAVMCSWMKAPGDSNHCNKRPGLLAAVFTSLSRCHVEVCLPMYLSDLASRSPTLNSSREVSLYQLVVEHVCTFIANCPASLFGCVEVELLSAVLNPDTIISLAASDCWCFMARSGSEGLRFHHAEIIVSVLQRLHSVSTGPCVSNALSVLLRRFVKYLSAWQQKDLFSGISSHARIVICVYVGMRSLDMSVSAELCSTLLPSCLDCLDELCHGNLASWNLIGASILAMQFLYNVIEYDMTSCIVTPHQGASLMKIMYKLWSVISIDSVSSSWEDNVNACYLSWLLILTSGLLRHISSNLLSKVLSICSMVLVRKSSADILLAAIKHLRALGAIEIPDNAEKEHLLEKVEKAFQLGLCHPLSWVRWYSVLAFTTFAQHTVHASVIPRCLGTDASSQAYVTAYLQKMVPALPGVAFDAVAFLKDQHKRLSSMQTNAALDLKRVSEGDSCDPGCKRLKVVCREEADLPDLGCAPAATQVLEDLKALVLSLEQMSVDGLITDWLKEESRPKLHEMLMLLDYH